MPLNSRDLWLVLKAQDQTNRALNTFGRNVRNAGNQVRMAQLESEKASALSLLTQTRLNVETERSAIAQLSAQKAVLGQTYAQLQLNGASQAQLDTVKRQASAIDEEIIRRRSNVAAMGAQVVAQKQNIKTIDDNIAATRAYNNSIQDQEKNMAHLAGRMQSVAQTATAAGFAISAAGALTLIGLGKAISVSMEYERQTRLTATQVEGFSGNLEQLADIGRRVAKDIAVPFKDLQPALYDIFSSIDVNITDAEKLLTQFAKAAVAGQTDIQSVSRGTIGIMNAFGLGAGDLNRILDIQFTLVRKGIGTYDEWADRFGKVSPSAQRAGQSIEMMAAALAAATRFGVPAAQAATSVARAFDAFSNPKAAEALKKFGINIVDAKGNFRDFNVVMGEFRDALRKIPGEAGKTAAILEVFKGAGSTIEMRKFLQTLLISKDGLEQFNAILGDVTDSSGAMSSAYNLMADSAAAKTQLLRNQWSLMLEQVGKALTPIFIKVVDWVTKLIESFNNLSPATKKLVSEAVLLAGVFAAVVGPMLLLVGVIAAFAAAFAVAGTAILVTVGILSALVIGLAGLTAAVVVAWKKSEGFRDTVKEVAKEFKKMRDTLVEVARDLKEKFDKEVRPPLEKLISIIKDKVLPQIEEFRKKVADELIPRLREAARIIKDMLGKALEFVGFVIRDIVNPAVQFMSNWWEKHRKTIEPLIPLFMQVAKWILVVAAVIVGILAVALLGPVVAAFAAVGAAIFGVIAAFTYIAEGAKWLYKQLDAFGNWLNSVFASAWDYLVSHIEEAFSNVATVFGAIWGGIKDGWNNVVAGITDLFTYWPQVWLDYWNTFTTVLAGIWGVIKSYAEGIWNGIMSVINAAMQAAANFIISVWNAVTQFIATVWDRIKGISSGGVGAVLGAISSGWAGVVAATVGAWNNLVAFISGALNNAKGIVNNAINTIRGYFDGAIGWLKNAGQNIIQGLINGILNMLGPLGGAMSRVGAAIANHLPGSPVKEGPLKVLNNGYAGKQITKMLAGGIMNGIPTVQNAANQMASQMNTGFTTPDNGYGMQNSSTGWTKTVNNEFNITTQEIDPKTHAAQLGWELAKVM